MQNKTKINLYDIKVAKGTSKVFIKKKHITKIKTALFTLLAVTSILSIAQSVFLFNSKTSYADTVQQPSSISSSVISKKIK
jgi:hypothetical protein